MPRRTVRRKRPIRDAAASVENAGYWLARAARAAERAADTIEDTAAEIRDGFDVVLVFDDDFNLFSLAKGGIKELPVRVRIKPLEPGEE